MTAKSFGKTALTFLRLKCNSCNHVHLQNLGTPTSRQYVTSWARWVAARRQSSKLQTIYPRTLSVTPKMLYCNSGSSHTTEDEIDKLEEEEYGEYVREICAIPGMGHRVLVIQPDIKTGARRYVLTSRELKLEETCALVRTLPKWRVIEKKIVRTDQENTSHVFGSGNFKSLSQFICGNNSISAVVIGIDRLTGLQVSALQKAWGLPVYDRYTIVLQIFKDHAKSPEAKLQVALAEIPYIRSRLFVIHGGFDAGVGHLVGGAGGNIYLDRRRLLLQNRESRLKKELAKLRSSRQEVREYRTRNSVPTVAVVGYTNSGKTTLIKGLTQDKALVPENNLFATLDVTAHEGRLASMLKVLYIDTVGFISDMPTTLLEAFRTTLDDAVVADAVVHVRDASHPDSRLQAVSVHRTLSTMLSEDRLQEVIEVYNKVDLLSESAANDLDPSILQISAVKGQGLAEMCLRLEDVLEKNAGLMKKNFRIPNDNVILEWLYKESSVKSVIPDPKNGQFLIASVTISKPGYAKFQARFARRESHPH